MSWGRVLSSSAATVAVAAGVLVAVGMNGHGSPKAAAKHSGAAVSHAPIPAVKSFAHRSSSATTTPAAPTLVVPAAPSRSASSVAAPVSHPDGDPVAAATTPAAAAHVVVPAAAPAPRTLTTAAVPTVHRTAAPAPAVVHRGVSLPLRYTTGNATRVITVTARSTGSTTATLQAWTKVAAGGWKRTGVALTAHIGSDGMTTHTSESRSATPMGSFTLTQAFGSYANPGTGLPYFATTPADYWISDEGRYYNTHQRCPASNAGCHDDGVNERLYYETPYYRYAVVIDANTRNAPGGVHAGRGSAFFLHVTDGRPTAGCVAIDQNRLVSIMKWLTPSAHPRILIGTV